MLADGAEGVKMRVSGDGATEDREETEVHGGVV
jgi:hypothetical protein